MRRPTPAVALLALILALLVVLVFSGDTALAENRTLRVVYTEWYPYTYTEGGQPKGFETDILAAVLARLGYAPSFTAYPWKRCLTSLENGRADLLVSMLKSPEREAFTLFPDEPVSLSQTVLFTRRDRAIPFAGDLEALRGLRIGVILGFSYGPAFDQATYLDLDHAVDTRILVEKILARRDDVAAENMVVVKALARQMGAEEDLRFLAPPIHHHRLYVGFSRANGLEKLTGDFSNALKAFKKTGEYRAILSRYGLGLDEMNETAAAPLP